MKKTFLLLLIPSLFIGGCGCSTEKPLTFEQFQLMVKDCVTNGIEKSGEFRMNTQMINVTPDGDVPDTSTLKLIFCNRDEDLLNCYYFSSPEGYVFNMANYKTYVKTDGVYVLDPEKDAHDVYLYYVYNYNVIKTASMISNPQNGTYNATVGSITYQMNDEAQTLFEVKYRKEGGKNILQSISRIESVNPDTKSKYYFYISSFTGTVPEIYEAHP